MQQRQGCKKQSKRRSMPWSIHLQSHPSTKDTEQRKSTTYSGETNSQNHTPQFTHVAGHHPAQAREEVTPVNSLQTSGILRYELSLPQVIPRTDGQ